MKNMCKGDDVDFENDRPLVNSVKMNVCNVHNVNDMQVNGLLVLR